jgi:hypothetical protein
MGGHRQSRRAVRRSWKRQVRAGDQQRRQGQAPRSDDLAVEAGSVTIAKV